MTKFIHYRWGTPPKTKGGVTFAYVVDGTWCAYAIAKCSAKDNYNKRVGRTIAQGRLDKSIGEGNVRSVNLHGQPKDWPQQIINHYADSL